MIRQTREEARALRQSSQEVRRRAEELMARARDLCTHHEKLRTEEAKARVYEEPQTYRRIHTLRLDVLKQLKQSLSDLENVRMIPEQEPKLRDLKKDIRKTIHDARNT